MMSTPSPNQPRSLVYAQDKNGCNGYDAYVAHQPMLVGNQAAFSDMDYGMAAGPFSDGESMRVGGFIITPPPPHFYDACYFWMSWYGTHGMDGLNRLLAAQNVADDADGFTEVSAIIERATGEPILDDLVHFGAASLTGRGYRWGPANGKGRVLDWAAELDRWRPAPLDEGEPVRATLHGGGAMARELTTAGTLTVEPARLPVVLVRENGKTRRLKPGHNVRPPAGGRAWILVVHPKPGAVEATLSLDK